MVETRASIKKKQADNLSLFDTLKYFLLAIIRHSKSLLPSHPLYPSISIAFLSILIYLYTLDGPHQPYFQSIEDNTLWYGWWLILGIASSIGLGTGLHTFVLFLGPFIAKVAIHSYSCNSTDFLVHGPDSFKCPSTPTKITILTIFQKVLFESMLWGAGTALGELPPYFIAKAASLSSSSDEVDAVELLLKKDSLTISEKVQVGMYKLMENWGFFGILVCASIPNPLFDLAGIVCGHFGVPFITFFGATFIGKAFGKSSIQSIFVILLFSRDILHQILSIFPKSIEDPLQKIIDSQLLKYSGNESVEQSDGIVSVVWNGFIFCMIAYFVVSLVVSLAKVEYSLKIDSEDKKGSKSPRKSPKKIPEMSIPTRSSPRRSPKKSD